MLGIHGVGRDKADYYLSDLARELPLSGPGRWAGTAAAGLGLAGPVDPDSFRRLLEGRHPATGVVLGSGRTTVAAFDLTFSAPKSASVLFALGGTDAASAVVVLLTSTRSADTTRRASSIRAESRTSWLVSEVCTAAIALASQFVRPLSLASWKID